MPDCVALYSFTGMATRPNEMVREPMERAAMPSFYAWRYFV